MVKPAKNSNRVNPKIADDFAMKAVDEDSVKAVKRGNPRPKKNKTVSFSIPIAIDSEIDKMIALLADDGVYGISRSDIVVAALSSELFKDKLRLEVERVKGFK
jgi:hypothetical protein